ncbi:two-component sensor histidine kinase, partial [Flavobacteriaceae bacterium]|nr:two-component sensor histidine kinase [Flavobacteriaceae bacterium]
MILLVVMTSLLILGATFYQYYSQSDDYNLRRLERKETQVKNHLSYILDRDDAFNTIGEKQLDFYEIFESIALIHKVEYALFSLEGVPYFYSYVKTENMDQDQQLDPKITQELLLNERQRIAIQNEQERGRFQSSYSVLFDTNKQPYAILYFPYFEDVSFSTTELNTFLMRLFQIYFFMLLVAIIIAYFISSYMTRPLETIRARSEREQAWQEMAKQVAHEIKNPLTPMRLTIQSFQQRFDPEDPKINQKVMDFSKIMIEQIDTMSRVATAFSN